MKKQILLALMCSFSLVAVSQVKYGIKAGTTLSWYRSSTDEGVVFEYETLAGFHGGVFAEAVINSYFSFQPELLFSTRGAKSEIEETYAIPASSGYTQLKVKLKSTSTPLYIDLPAYLKVGFPSVGTDRFTIGSGPMLSYGIGGKSKITGSLDDVHVKGEMKLFSDGRITLRDEDGNDYAFNETSPAVLKRFDVGIACFAAYEFSARVLLSLNYQYGLKNISEDPDEDLWNRCFTISLGYKF